MPTFRHEGHRLDYTIYGDGPRTFVLVHVVHEEGGLRRVGGGMDRARARAAPRARGRA